MEYDRKEVIYSFILDKLSQNNFNKFQIPLYQRKYAWTDVEVKTLLDDLYTFKDKSKNGEKYFIGNIVVEKKDDEYEIIDGQQRFTTIYLMSKLIDESYFELDYSIRENDGKFLKNLNIFSRDNIKEEVKKYKADEQFIVNLDTIFEFFKDKDIEISDEENGLKSLLKLCKLTITVLPKDVDIVKYFEVLNNRGKQLEKHQILKAKFIENLIDNNEANYAKIWDYCSNMSVYLDEQINYKDQEKDEKNIQEIRKSFGDYLNKEESLPDYFKEKDRSNKDKLSILEIIDKGVDKNEKVDFYERKSYVSIIKFPIFLIQVLKIYLAKNFKDIDLKNYVVNERYLLDYFLENGDHLKEIIDAKKFIFFLLKMRILFDQHIFKRDKDQKPDLYKYASIDSKNNILNLQLLFSYTSPQRITQDWVSVALKWLDENNRDDDFIKKYASFLMEFDTALAKTRLDDTNKLIDQINNYLCKEEYAYTPGILFDLNVFAKLNSGVSTPHYWFYKLDYLLWKHFDWTQEFSNKFSEVEKFKYTDIKNNFRLSQLNSIEHIFPQSKADEWKSEDTHSCNAKRKIDCFGNLALISNHLNSALSDDRANKKERIQMQLNNGTLESLKMLLVYSNLEKSTAWTQAKCQDHHNKMIEILQDSLANV